MPIFSYFAVVGSLLLGLLFAVDAVLPPNPAPRITSSFYGLPPAWRGPANAPSLASTPAPEPDMSSPAVLAAAPPPTVLAAAPPPADVAPPQASKPVKRKHVARKHQQDNERTDYRTDYRSAFDWSWQDGNRRWASRGAPPWMR